MGECEWWRAGEEYWVPESTVCRGDWGSCSDKPGEEVDINALSEKVAALLFCEGGCSCVARFEAHQGLSHGSVWLVESVFVYK